MDFGGDEVIDLDALARDLAAVGITSEMREWRSTGKELSIGVSSLVLTVEETGRVYEFDCDMMENDLTTDDLKAMAIILRHKQAHEDGYIPDGGKWGADWKIKDGTVYVWNVISRSWVDRDSPPSEIEQKAWEEYALSTHDAATERNDVDTMSQQE